MTVNQEAPEAAPPRLDQSQALITANSEEVSDLSDASQIGGYSQREYVFHEREGTGELSRVHCQRRAPKPYSSGAIDHAHVALIHLLDSSGGCEAHAWSAAVIRAKYTQTVYTVPSFYAQKKHAKAVCYLAYA
jgi:hypothetical protein